MPNDTNNHDSHEFEKITPAKIQITPHSKTSSSSIVSVATGGQRKWMIISFVLSMVLAIAVFLLLPQVISKPEIELEAVLPVTKPEPEISPWQEAQMARDRKAAQEVLAQLLDQQFTLEELHVDLWAGDRFIQASELALEGDEVYRQRKFEAAKRAYSSSLELLQELVANIDSVKSQQLQQGDQAIMAGNADMARAAFDLVLQIDPENVLASDGLQRASTLNHVMQLVAQANEQQQLANLDQARSLLQQALKLDAELIPARQELLEVQQKIVDRDFAAAMSSGYRALQQSKLTQARTEFDRARRLKPQANEARTGLEEATHRIAQNKIAAYRSEATVLIEQEKWQQAQGKYQALLNLDSSLIFAQEGLKRTSNRARLDELLQKQLIDPQRLASAEVGRESDALLKVARTVANPGPRLQGQVERLRLMLQQAKQPSVVEILSDNQTDVTLYKIGHLGNFINHQLSLKPGSYVLVGKCDGYRDVRKEFIVLVNQAPPPIKIQCMEKI